MEIILLEDVKTLGKKGQTVTVNEGYARNFIIPKKLGVEANAKNKNDLKLQKAHADKVAKEQLEAAKEFGAKLAETTLELKVKSGKDGKVFGSVSSKEIAAAAKDQFGMEIDKKKIVIADPIKSCGVHMVNVKLHKDVTAQLKVHVSEA